VLIGTVTLDGTALALVDTSQRLPYQWCPDSVFDVEAL